MKRTICLILPIFMMITACALLAQDTDEVISSYKGSELVFDDDIGYETLYYLNSDTSHKAIDGTMRRRFFKAPAGVTPYEIIKNFEKAISSKGGTIIHSSRDAYRYTDPKTGERVWFMKELFTNGRRDALSRGHWGYAQLPSEAEDYVVGKIATPAHDIFISVASAVVSDNTWYEIVTVLAEPMAMNNVTLNVVNDGIAQNGRVAIYDIYFDTGKAIVKDESSQALRVIADFLKEHTGRKFLIVGHTDNTGDFEANIALSTARANAVIDKLVSDYGCSREQLKAYGVASTSPQMSNSSKDGRARNRRVELVEF